MARAVQIALGVLPARERSEPKRPAPAPKKPCKRCGNLVCTCIEDALAGQMRAAGFPEPVRQLGFAREIGRGWKADFGWGFIRLLVECEGGIWSGGAHVRGRGYADDCEKYNRAQLLGWLVLRFTKEMVDDGSALSIIEEALKARGVRLGGPVPVYTRRYGKG